MDKLMEQYWQGKRSAVAKVNAMPKGEFDERWGAYCMARARSERRNRQGR